MRTEGIGGRRIWVIVVIILVAMGAYWVLGYSFDFLNFDKDDEAYSQKTDQYLITQLVENQAKAWETGDIELLKSTMHPDIIFAYPGRRLNFDQVVEDLTFYKDAFSDTKIYIHNIIIDGDMVAVEWQFASTEIESGKRTVVSDGIIGKIKDGKIIEWREYLDGRVSRMQKVGALPLEEGLDPFPSPEGSLRNFCSVACN